MFNFGEILHKTSLHFQTNTYNIVHHRIVLVWRCKLVLWKISLKLNHFYWILLNLSIIFDIEYWVIQQFVLKEHWEIYAGGFDIELYYSLTLFVHCGWAKEGPGRTTKYKVLKEHTPYSNFNSDFYLSTQSGTQRWASVKVFI